MSFGTMHINGVCVSMGNSKMGNIPSISLPPVVTCPKGVPCIKGCYACHMCKRYPSVDKSYKRNYEVYLTDPAAYFGAVYVAAMMSPFFRYHVAGDIPCMDYFERMIETAKKVPGCTFLCYTKAYDIVNTYLDNHSEGLPRNLVVRFSGWKDGDGWTMNNPHNIPVTDVIFPGDDIPESVFICPGNCAVCAMNKTGCYNPAAHVGIKFHR